MKKVLIYLFIAMMAVACGSQGEKASQEQAQETKAIDPANLETIAIEVHGMTCNGCERTVQTAVGKLAGVQDVKASHLDSTAIVTFDKTQANYDEMKAAIADKGYTAIDFKVIKE